jgi:hypothetical protein
VGKADYKASQDQEAIAECIVCEIDFGVDDIDLLCCCASVPESVFFLMPLCS